MNRLVNIVINLKKSQAIVQNAQLPSLCTILRTLQSGRMELQKPRATTPGLDKRAPTKKKVPFLPKITLIAQNESMSVTTLEEAQKLAKRRDLQLLQVQQMDTKTQRPVYKLITTAEKLAQEGEESPSGARAKNQEKDIQMKSEKSLSIGSRITEHDLASRLKHISKWLAKNHEVRIYIQGHADDLAACEKIFKLIEKTVREPATIGKIVQKHTKGGVIKFNIVPLVSTSNDIANAQSPAATTSDGSVRQLS